MKSLPFHQKFKLIHHGLRRAGCGICLETVGVVPSSHPMRSIAQSLSRGFALGGAIPLILISLLSAAAEVPHFFDPCFSWGDTGGRSVSPLDTCRGRMAGTSETMAGTIVRLTLIQGTALCAAVLGLKGSYRSKPQLTLTAAIILFLLTLPLIIGRAGLMTLVCALCFLVSFSFSYFVRTTSV